MYKTVQCTNQEKKCFLDSKRSMRIKNGAQIFSKLAPSYPRPLDFCLPDRVLPLVVGHS